MRSVLNCLILSGLILACSACGRDDPSSQSQELEVVATYSILGDLVHQVGGEHVGVRTLVGPDGDAHTYEPTPKDSVALHDARLVFENGLGFETWLDDLYDASGSAAQRIVVTRSIEPRGIDHEEQPTETHEDQHDHDGHDHAEHDDHDHVEKAQGHDHHHDHGEFDPHVWHDVPNAIAMVEVIADALAEADPANAATYHANRDRYVGELRELDAWVHSQVKTIPAEHRVLVTSHDTFGYFADRYGFRTVTVLGSVSSEMGDPSAAAVAEVVEQVKASGVPAVFAENILSPRLTEQIARQAGVTVVPTLYTDALGAADSEGASYINMIRHNVRTIVEALR